MIAAKSECFRSSASRTSSQTSATPSDKSLGYFSVGRTGLRDGYFFVKSHFTQSRKARKAFLVGLRLASLDFFSSKT